MVWIRGTAVLADAPSATHPALELPPARDFITSAGFGGTTALLAAVLLAFLVLGTGWRASKRHRAELEQRDLHYTQTRDDQERAAEVALCEQRFRWVVDTAGIEPAASQGAALGLGPELALELLIGLHRDAARLGDETLARAIAVYLNQFSLVLAQQGGPLSQLSSNADGGGESAGTQHARKVAAVKRARSGVTGGAVEPEPENPATGHIAASTLDDDSAAPPASATASGRRRRR